MKKMRLTIVLLIATFAVACGQDDTFNKVMHFPQGFTVGNNPEVQLQPFTGELSGDVEWDNVKNKPEVFPPDMSAVETIQLQEALEQLGFYFGKTTAELDAIVPVNGFGIALNKTTGYYMVFSEGKWETIITDR